MKPTHFIVHYAEIGLKGKNRKRFEDQLINNIKHSLKGTGIKSVNRIAGRILIELGSKPKLEQIIEQLRRVFGVSHFSPAVKTKAKFDEIKAVALNFAKNLDWDTFRVTTRRSNKLFPMNSMEVSREVGAYILDNSDDKKVKIKDPDLEIQIEIVDQEAFVFADKIRAFGGLPVGSSGKVVSLLSGGIDSPVASWRLMKRGCEVVFVHFHSRPQTDRASVDKVVELAEILSGWQIKTKLYLVPFLEIQKAIVQETKGDYRVVLYRRFMYRIAEAVAKKEKARALVTGEAVGQVASQTLENIAAINDAVTIPILRPLIGMDKNEIINEAKTINTYEQSIVPHGDCCSLFVPRHPVTKGSVRVAREEEGKLNVELLVNNALKNSEIIEF